MRFFTKIRHALHRQKQRTKYFFGVKTGPSHANRRAMDNTRQESVITAKAALKARILRKRGTVEDLGVVSTRLVTDAFIDFLVDQLQSSTGEIADFTYHGSGISSTAENAAQTALISEIGVSRVNGTQGEGGTSQVYSTIGIQYYDGPYAVREHGLFNQASGGIMMDRSVFPVINVAQGDGIEFTYELTITGS